MQLIDKPESNFRFFYELLKLKIRIRPLKIAINKYFVYQLNHIYLLKIILISRAMYCF